MNKDEMQTPRTPNTEVSVKEDVEDSVSSNSFSIKQPIQSRPSLYPTNLQDKEENQKKVNQTHQVVPWTIR